jgi:gamma-butyrobetaine dioxygenase
MIISSTQTFEDHLVIEWSDGSRFAYYYIWLYDNRPDHWHYNGQKLSKTLDIPVGIKPIEINTSPSSIQIVWPNGEASYSSDFLSRNIYKPQNTKQKLWNKFDQHTIHFYPQLLKEKSSLLKCLEDVNKYGFARISAVLPEEGEVLRLVDLFGFVRETDFGMVYDECIKEDPDNLTNTAIGLSPHTKNPYRNPVPTLHLMHSLLNLTTGGEIILIDGFYLAEKLESSKPEYFHLLSTYSLHFKFENETQIQEFNSPIFGLDNDGNLVNIRFNNRSVQPFQVPEDVMTSFYAAYQYFEQMLQDERYQLRFKLEEGQALIIDNERILTGRLPYEALKVRHLQGCFADKDALTSKMKVLKRKRL